MTACLRKIRLIRPSTICRIAVATMLLVVCLALLTKGRGYKTCIIRLVRGIPARQLHGQPVITGGLPGDMESNILPETAIAAFIKLPNGKLDLGTVSSRTVRLLRTLDGMPVPAAVEVSSSGHKIILRPQTPLAPNTNYTFCVTEELKDICGVSTAPWSVAFTTKARIGEIDPTIRFDAVRLKNTSGTAYTALRVGPDHQLYAAADDGRIFRYPIEEDGTLGTPLVIESLRRAWGGPRIVIGLCFEPSSTAAESAIWVTHNEYKFEAAADWTGAVSRLSGRNLEDVRDAVIHLPRSFRDHMTNQPAFGPDGALYFPQGSNSAFGAPDSTWGNRPEHLLSASILRLDVANLSGAKPIDALTRDGGGNFDPSNKGPLTIYATGVRNAYSLLWHSNGHLYVPTNGSSPGGNTPAVGSAPGLIQLPFSEDDLLFDVRPGKYYGHPNPSQGHFILHGGKPTVDAPSRIPQYPLGTQPDPEWEPAIFNFGKHASANGVIEYRGSAFGGRLDHKLLVCQFNVGSDIIALGIGADGEITSAQSSIPGLRSLVCPLDLVQDPRNGNLYISEYGAKRIMIARPVDHSVRD